MLIATAVVAAFFGLAPRAYNWHVWRPVEAELTAWLAEAEFPNQGPLGYDYFAESALGGKSCAAVNPPIPSYPIYQIGNHPLEIGEVGDDYTGTEPAADREYYIWPPGRWVESKNQALEVWREDYIARHGWRWPRF